MNLHVWPADGSGRRTTHLSFFEQTLALIVQHRCTDRSSDLYCIKGTEKRLRQLSHEYLQKVAEASSNARLHRPQVATRLIKIEKLG